MKMNAREVMVVGVLLLLAMLGVAGCERRKPTRAAAPLTPLATTATPGPRSGSTAVAKEVTTTLPAGGQVISSTPTLASLETPTPTGLPPTVTPTPTMAMATLTPTLPSPPTVTPVATPATIQHTVKAGETLYRIALTYNTTAAAILAANPAVQDPNHLVAGTVLVITMGNAPAAPTGRTHVVQRGDTVSSIARRYGITVEALLQANGLANPNRILVGQVLQIP
jgi:LysM repeat protein